MTKFIAVLLGSRLFSSHSNGLRILQASWHPYSSNHLGVLSSDSVMRLFDLSSDLERAEQEFYLQPENRRNQNTPSLCPIAFSFGVNHLWERFSIFLLYSNGSLYILCPVVPFGSLCSWMHIEEIYNDAHICVLDSSDARVSRNSGLAITWLEATFPKLVDRKMEGGNVIVLRAHSYTPLDASLALQGPLVSASNREKNETYVSSTYCEGKPVNFMYNSIGKDSVFIIAWSSALLEIYALADEIQPLWNVGNSPHLSLDPSGNIDSVAVICQSDLEEVSTEQEFKKIRGASADVSSGHLPPLLKISIVDLQLPKNASNGCLLSLLPDPLVSKRFYCIHTGGMDMVILHALPFSDMIPEKDAMTSSICPILLTPHSESSRPVLCGYVIVTDSYGHSQFVGVTPTYECLVLEMKGWSDEMLPSHFNLDVKPSGSTEALVPEILSKELISGPKAIVIPSSTSLQSLTPDSIEGRSTLHHYVKLFHENYVEYAHKVYIELEHHGEYVKTIIDSQQQRLKAVEQSLSKLENNENGVKDRINRAFKVYELLDQRLQNFKVLPSVNKKPLSKAEREFNAELDRIVNHELDSLDSSIDSLNTRLRRFLQSSSNSPTNMGRAAPGRRKDYVPDDLALKLKSSLDLLSGLNSQNMKKVKLIEDTLNNQQK
ncbi:hypothetical protein KSP39_PZI018299 [Platanthera zijinensis]|uniref:Nuclear pore complex protein NUP88 n=1 Tax=Platanthera zijinensis TaxID=2320716 RepID=A0AAP0B3A2_9ASPA